ncbi:MAG: hypothetical protein JOY86_03320, partial [Candidatus Eremiobacteraeota bacterium]|nr:hypothetical protein [Candidatus Eremiobacteraeota bacterium]
MKRFAISAIFGFALATAGCSSSSTSTPPITFQNIYVGDRTNNSISIFASHANGNVAPMSSISGAATLLNEPYYIFVDSSGNTWASNYTGGVAGSITKYTAGSSGNTAPATTISGASTLLVGPCGIYVDAAGKIYNA